MLPTNSQIDRSTTAHKIQASSNTLSLPPEILEIIFSYMFRLQPTRTMLRNLNQETYTQQVIQSFRDISNIRKTCRLFNHIIRNYIVRTANEATRKGSATLLPFEEKIFIPLEALLPPNFLGLLKIPRTLFTVHFRRVSVNIFFEDTTRALSKMEKEYSVIEEPAYPIKVAQIVRFNLIIIEQLFQSKIPGFSKDAKIFHGSAPSLLDAQEDAVKQALRDPVFFEELLKSCTFIPDDVSKYIVAAHEEDIGQHSLEEVRLFISMLIKAVELLHFEVVNYLMKFSSKVTNLDSLFYGNDSTWRREIMRRVFKDNSSDYALAEVRTTTALYTGIHYLEIQRDIKALKSLGATKAAGLLTETKRIIENLEK